MTTQATAEADTRLSSFLGIPGITALNLSGVAAIYAELNGMLLVERAKSDQQDEQHGIIDFGNWFYELEDGPKQDVLDYFNSLIVGYGLRLRWFARGHVYGYHLFNTR